MGEEQQRCLEALADTTYPDGEVCTYFHVIEAQTGYDRKTVRRHVRALARKGYAEYFRGLFTEDGVPAGAGYCITWAGKAALSDQAGEMDND